MGERAQKVVIQSDRVKRYRSQWGGPTCPQVLLHGRAGLEEDLSESRKVDKWLDPDFAEGGYLVDFDHRAILLYSWDRDLLKGLTRDLKSVWPDWSIEMTADGVLDFQHYLEKRLPSSGT